MTSPERKIDAVLGLVQEMVDGLQATLGGTNRSIIQVGKSAATSDSILALTTTIDGTTVTIDATTVTIDGLVESIDALQQKAIIKSTDESKTTDTTLANDAELLFAVAANEDWQFDGFVFAEQTVNGELKFTFDGPTGAVGGWFVESNFGNAGDTAGELGEVSAETSQSPLPFTAYRFWGSIANGSTPGNLSFRWAQNQSHADPTVIHAGSYLKYQKK